MKIYYINNTRLPTERAHGLQIMKTCQALADKGVFLELIIPRRFNKIKENPFDYYGIKSSFKIKKIFSLDITFLGKLLGKTAFLSQSASFAKIAFLFVFLKVKKSDIIYSRHFFTLLFVSFLDRKFIYEMHTFPKKYFWHKRVFKKSFGIVAITNGLKNKLVEKGIPENKILVLPDGVDLNHFNINLSKADCRQKVNLPIDKKVILYSGHLYNWKGGQTLAKAAGFFGNDYLFVFVGGTKEDIKRFKKRISAFKNIMLVGHQLHKSIPYWLKAADLLVLPNSGKMNISKYWTSPMKMFEYMVSKRPITASDLPSIREVLNENNAFLVKPDNEKSLAEGIKYCLNNLDFSEKISEQAFKDVQKYSWDKRAEKFLSFIKKETKK